MLTTIQNIKPDYAAVKRASKILRALNHDLRQQIIGFINEKKETDVTSIYSSLRMQQSVASQHLAILRGAGVVKAQRAGRMIMYSLNSSQLVHATQFVDNMLSEAKGGQLVSVPIKRESSLLLV